MFSTFCYFCEEALNENSTVRIKGLSVLFLEFFTDLQVSTACYFNTLRVNPAGIFGT